MNPTYYIGLDVHKKMTNACIMDDVGEVVLEKRFPTNKIGVDYLANNLPPGEYETAVEASSCIYPFVDLLCEKKLGVSLAHPLGVKWVTCSEKKTDRIDALKLADLLRRDSLPYAYLPSKEVREVRSLVRERIQYKKQLTGNRNQIHWQLMYRGLTIGHKIASKAGKKELSRTGNRLIQRKVSIINALDKSIQEVNVEIHEVFQNNSYAKTLGETIGVGEYSAVLISAEIADVYRFPNPKKLCAYAGLVPTISQSGEKTYMGRTRKHCNHRLKGALITCAHVAVQHDPKMREYYQRLEPRIGTNKAIVAVAHKMLTLMYWKLKNQQTKCGGCVPGI
jgi:transposase